MAVFSRVAWVYKELIASAKLQQMADNLELHNHHDTYQGASLSERYTRDTTPAGSTSSTVDLVTRTFTPPAGWSAYSVELVGAVAITTPASATGLKVALSLRDAASGVATVDGHDGQAAAYTDTLAGVARLGVYTGSSARTFRAVLAATGGPTVTYYASPVSFVFRPAVLLP